MGLGLLRAIRRTGHIAEPAPPPPGVADAPAGGPGAADVIESLGGSVQIRHVDAGSCNGCEIEIGAAFGPVYDAERYGARLVASPRHADAVLVTGVVTRNMAEALRVTHQATPGPTVVLAVGDCARNCGVFAGSAVTEGAVRDVVPVDIEVAGCPPRPEQIVAALRAVTRR